MNPRRQVYPGKKSACYEADDDVILVKDLDRRVIGFERLSYLSTKQRKDCASSPFEECLDLGQQRRLALH